MTLAMRSLKPSTRSDDSTSSTPMMAKIRPSLKFWARKPAIRGKNMRARDPEAANQP